jgi:hypothetical protein
MDPTDNPRQAKKPKVLDAKDNITDDANQVEEQKTQPAITLDAVQAVIDAKKLEQPAVLFAPAAADKACVLAVFKDGRTSVLVEDNLDTLENKVEEAWRIYNMGPNGPHE